MRSLLVAGLILLIAPQVRAQQSLPRFALNGHRAGETSAAGEPWTECRKLDDVTQMCTREGEAIGSMKIDAGYLYRNDRLALVHVKADSAAAFDPLLAVLIKRYGAPRALRRGKGVDYAQWLFRDGRLHLTRTGTLVIAQFAAGR
ncbi:MAG TPA: hypothetical protein VJN70_06210 [Gemmatimonadaceae bacterium]|nr:hypothetical protein [Gemmatimonadaceae bacterium]